MLFFQAIPSEGKPVLPGSEWKTDVSGNCVFCEHHVT
uniref:Uncharacterized protein n=1 Tax=Virus sp. ctAgr11 TaxID=2825800 RepID=A0A8S5RJ42_9VIRU|nr:MAG TPA: hypothetical protein [Virus sp. ctAgr11]DAJ19264.1 MAG TPA: hypothetical protein [Phage sp. ctgku9]DAO77853.1 MAG TPA: hypothetical protein [Bacteriophage sp.]DAP79481.1 MAG TPA: hypothetical protein [Caudoviricetes sp.]DAU21976.1 MAG TPA: hypothetical protein [Bacteriophage sp.]